MEISEEIAFPDENEKSIDSQIVQKMLTATKLLDSLNSFNSLIFLETKSQLPKYHLHTNTTNCKQNRRSVNSQSNK